MIDEHEDIDDSLGDEYDGLSIEIDTTSFGDDDGNRVFSDEAADGLLVAGVIMPKTGAGIKVFVYPKGGVRKGTLMKLLQRGQQNRRSSLSVVVPSHLLPRNEFGEIASGSS